MERLKLPMNAEKTRCCRLPEESMTFLGYRIGRNYRRDTGAAYIGAPEPGERPEHRVSELTTPRDLLLPPSVVVARLNDWLGELLQRSRPRLTATTRASGSVGSTTGRKCASRSGSGPSSLPWTADGDHDSRPRRRNPHVLERHWKRSGEE